MNQPSSRLAKPGKQACYKNCNYSYKFKQACFIFDNRFASLGEGWDTFIIRDGNNAQMNEPTDEDIKNIKDLYYKENATIDIIEYGDIGFSLNKGDYMKPKL